MRVDKRIKYKQKKLKIIYNKLHKKWISNNLSYAIMRRQTQELENELIHLSLKYQDETTRN